MSVKLILFLPVTAPKSIINPALALSTIILSQEILPTFVIFPSLTSKLVPTIAANVPAAGLAPPITVPSMVPPSILAVVTVPKSAIVVPLNVEFLPNTICSLLFVVTNFR